MDDSLGIGFVGAGFITREFHADSLLGIRDAHCAGVMNPTPSKAEAVAADCRERGVGDPATYGDVRELTRDPDVDALWIAAPNHVRVETVDAVVEELEQGRAELDGVAVEKPLARTLGEAEHVVERLESTGVAGAYLENQTYMPGTERMRELLWDAAGGGSGSAEGRPESDVDAGGDDRPYLARAAEEHAGPHSGWFWDPEKQGGGVLSDMMCHSHELNRHLLSDGGRVDLEPFAVAAETSTLKWGRKEYAEDLREEYGVDYGERPAEDYARASVFYETPDGQLVVGEATNSWCFVGTGLRISVELLGPEYSGRVNTLESGTDVFLSDEAESDGYFVEKQAASTGQASVLADETATYGYLAQNRHVVERFREGRDAREDLRDGLEVVRLNMAAYRAAETGERVDPADVAPDYVPEPARGEFEAGPAGVR